MGEAPYTFGQAQNVARKASRLQKAAEDFSKQMSRDFAHAEEAYRVALAVEIVRQHDEDGVAWSVAPDLARGNKRVAELRRKRDIAEGMREAAVQASWRHTADRKDTQRFIDWSMRRELAEGAGMVPEPDEQPIIGGQRA